MARTGALKHTHQYFKRGDGRWACILDGCTHFVPKNMDPSPMGSPSICWRCEKEFRLTPALMQIDKPVCDECGTLDDVLDDYIEQKEREAREKMTPAQRMLAQFKNPLPDVPAPKKPTIVKKAPEVNEETDYIEVDEPTTEE